MAKVVLNPIPRSGVEYLLYCPGCRMEHWFRVSGAAPVWHFDGDLDCPTVTPSLLVQCRDRCHSYITKGNWVFLQDCSHKLAGQTVAIPEYDEND